MSKKKIGVLNFQYSTHNYGAVLQAAALEFILSQYGHDVEHIDYIPKRKKSFKSAIRILLSKTGLLKSNRKKKPENSQVFEKFRVKFINRSVLVETPEEFEQLSGNYDVVVVGSDQVWRPRMSSDPSVFFLKYVPSHVKRVAYAASFGAAEWELDMLHPLTKMAQDETSKFLSISCRETSGVQICKKIFGIEATHVLDPLLQVSDEFIESVLATAEPSKSKLVYYKLDADDNFMKALSEIERQYACKAHNIYARNGNLNEYEEVAQWLRNISDADIVVSDSFHCICLGLRLGKTVIYSPNPRRGQARMDDLFNYLKIDLRKVELRETKTQILYSLKRSESFLLELKRLREHSSNKLGQWLS